MSVVGLSAGGVTVETGDFHSCVLLEDTTVRCWGGNVYGELGIGSNDGSSVPVEVHCE